MWWFFLGQLERRLAELRESSESMAHNLGKAEKNLQVLSIGNDFQRSRLLDDDDFRFHDDNLHIGRGHRLGDRVLDFYCLHCN